MLHRLYLHQISAVAKVVYYCLSCLVALHSGIFSAVFVYMSIIGHYVYDRKIVAQTDLKVIGVMRRSYLDSAGAEIHLDIIVSNNRYFGADKRQSDLFADKILISFIIRIDRNGSIAEQRFRSGRGKLNISAAVGQRITQMPEISVLFAVFDLSVRDRGQAMRAPVDDPLAAVYQSLFVKADKDLSYSL